MRSLYDVCPDLVLQLPPTYVYREGVTFTSVESLVRVRDGDTVTVDAKPDAEELTLS